MKARTFFLLLSGALFLAALAYYVMDQKEENISFLQVQKRVSGPRESHFSREVDRPARGKSEGGTEEDFKEKTIFFRDSVLLSVQKRECQYGVNVFKDNPDFVDSQSDFYKNPAKIKDKAEYMLFSYASGLMDYVSSFIFDYNKVREDPLLTDIKSWREVEETFSGCGKEADIGLFMLTLAEVIKDKKIKKWFLGRAIKMAKLYLDFGTITGQIYAVGLLKNLVISKQVKGYLVHELYTLGEDMERQAFAFREMLHSNNKEEVRDFLLVHNERKKNFHQRAIDIMEEIHLRAE